MGRISTHACRDKKSCICSAMGTRPHLGKLECPTALSGDGDLLKSGQRVHSKWHGMKVVGRQARWQNPHSPPSPGNAVCSWLNGVGEVCTHFHPFGKFLSNGKTEKLLHGKTSLHVQIVTPRLSTVNTESRNTCNLGSTDCFQQVIVISS